ncbi:DUF6069 family protein [Rhodococcus oxybenzonivorans]|jgi:small basic protein|uniref:Transmembrane protein n=1 Tax=Rhodococcus oxybenzonivorans TaxID=1990687 RepID=A0A2S2C1N2_9NOCA|nr:MULTISPECIES: DUF6069 family protein [Rhodococcus]AWK74795.1 hypothetical protein CBI38_27800 [Rhodococcus oxybenzonivorans]MDV7354847.1 DUF6069 family protein [Rhodococcus oxybenzonivorans]QHE70160.1 hypothetical protein GFS60_03739 [Rhodococcus sp. WAY2]
MSSTETTATATSAATKFNPLTLELSRPAAVLWTAVIALVPNLVLWLLALPAGASFEMTDAGKTTSAAPGGVVVMTVVPLLIGMTLAALISVKLPAIIRPAEVIGVVLALATIILTIQADFDAASTISLSLMHVVVAAAIVVGLEAMRRRIVRTANV